MSSCLLLRAGAHPRAVGAAALTEYTWRLWPGQVLWDLAAHAAPEGQHDGRRAGGCGHVATISGLLESLVLALGAGIG